MRRRNGDFSEAKWNRTKKSNKLNGVLSKNVPNNIIKALAKRANFVSSSAVTARSARRSGISALNATDLGLTPAMILKASRHTDANTNAQYQENNTMDQARLATTFHLNGMEDQGMCLQLGLYILSYFM